jgi:hypothetical protein
MNRNTENLAIPEIIETKRITFMKEIFTLDTSIEPIVAPIKIPTPFRMLEYAEHKPRLWGVAASNTKFPAAMLKPAHTYPEKKFTKIKKKNWKGAGRI